ncbi:MAG TPA: hypothetical protein VGC13_23560 [Longimicrobium sp.]|uniref:hypothetical protein n=1 Tax=Longimicrobium sp. TaxID=2029185 RepID=UPI002EDA38C5
MRIVFVVRANSPRIGRRRWRPEPGGIQRADDPPRLQCQPHRISRVFTRFVQRVPCVSAPGNPSTHATYPDGIFSNTGFIGMEASSEKRVSA